MLPSASVHTYLILAISANLAREKMKGRMGAPAECRVETGTEVQTMMMEGMWHRATVNCKGETRNEVAGRSSRQLQGRNQEWGCRSWQWRGQMCAARR
eukprot:405641-Pelagomonas_calceolata.AAC.4